MTYYIGSMPYGEQDVAHFGIKGMKWGVRRFRNEDGTLTQAGRERYGIKERYRDYRERHPNVHKLSAEELRARMSRYQQEQNYIRLQNEIDPSISHTITKGIFAAGRVLKAVNDSTVAKLAKSGLKIIGEAVFHAIAASIRNSAGGEKGKKGKKGDKGDKVDKSEKPTSETPKKEEKPKKEKPWAWLDDVEKEIRERDRTPPGKSSSELADELDELIKSLRS